jgi:hypothetical protein
MGWRPVLVLGVAIASSVCSSPPAPRLPSLLSPTATATVLPTTSRGLPTSVPGSHGMPPPLTPVPTVGAGPPPP